MSTIADVKALLDTMHDKETTEKLSLIHRTFPGVFQSAFTQLLIAAKAPRNADDRALQMMADVSGEPITVERMMQAAALFAALRVTGAQFPSGPQDMMLLAYLQATYDGEPGAAS